MAVATCAFTLAISIKMINIVVMHQGRSINMGDQSLASRTYFGKRLTPNQVDLILHAAILALSFIAVALAAVLGAGS
jgi:preprotein translocase subunit SecG